MVKVNITSGMDFGDMGKQFGEVLSISKRFQNVLMLVTKDRGSTGCAKAVSRDVTNIDFDEGRGVS